MTEEQVDITNYWAVGAGTVEHAKFLIKNNLWEDTMAKNGNPANKPILDQIKKGDYLLVQSSSAKNTGDHKTITKLKAVGKVIGRIKDNYYTFLVAWDIKDSFNFPKDFKGVWYSKSIEPMKVDEMLRYARKIINS